MGCVHCPEKEIAKNLEAFPMCHHCCFLRHLRRIFMNLCLEPQNWNDIFPILDPVSSGASAQTFAARTFRGLQNPPGASKDGAC